MIDVKNLTKYYGNHKVLDDITFHIEPGQTVGFLGNNGAGKSTTMNILTGYLAPTSGTITIGGHDSLDEPMAVRRLIGYCPENPPLYPELTVREYLAFACDLMGVKKADKQKQIEEIEEILKIGHMKDRLIANLSRGYRQRVGLAQALCGDPQVLILDEPTVGLDPTQIIDIRKTIKELGKKHTIVLSSHILTEVADVCDHIMILHNGRIVVSDSLENLVGSKAGTTSLKVRIEGDPAEAKELLSRVPGVTDVQASGDSLEEQFLKYTRENKV